MASLFGSCLCAYFSALGIVSQFLCVVWFDVLHWNSLVEIQAYSLLQVISQKGPSIYPVSGFLIKTGEFSFNFACVLFEKFLKICGLGSVKELFKKLKTYKALLYLICDVVPTPVQHYYW